MNAQDLQRIATRGHRAADLLAKDGRRALGVAAAHRHDPIKAASYTPEPRGNNPDDYGVDANSDPTSAAALANVEAFENEFARLVDTFHRFDAIIADVTERIIALAGTNILVDVTDDDLAGWCRSCARDKLHLEPQATHGDGRVRYRNACRWCHDFEATYGRPVPLPLLESKHAGQRITPRMVKKALRR